MTEAIFGLVGVIIGALIGSVTTFLLERKKGLLAARVAARLVRDELYVLAVLVEDLLTFENMSEEQLKEIKTRTATLSWMDQRVHLAAVMSYKGFADASLAISAANDFRFWLNHLTTDIKIGEKDKKRLLGILANLRPGLEVLKDVAK